MFNDGGVGGHAPRLLALFVEALLAGGEAFSEDVVDGLRLDEAVVLGVLVVRGPQVATDEVLRLSHLRLRLVHGVVTGGGPSFQLGLFPRELLFGQGVDHFQFGLGRQFLLHFIPLLGLCHLVDHQDLVGLAFVDFFGRLDLGLLYRDLLLAVRNRSLLVCSRALGRRKVAVVCMVPRSDAFRRTDALLTRVGVCGVGPSRPMRRINR